MSDVVRRGSVFEALMRSAATLCALAGFVLFDAPPRVAFGQTRATQHEHGTGGEAKTASKGVAEVGNLKVSLPDVELVTQDGKKVRFYSDLIKGRVVVVGFFYTSCEYVCAMQGSNFAALQKRLGDRLGRDVHLLLLTRDPRTDTPARLKAWAARYGVRPGWTLLTGRVENVERLVSAFTGDHVGPVESHSAGVYLGNDDAAAWTYASGLASPDALIKALDELRDKPPRL